MIIQFIMSTISCIITTEDKHQAKWNPLYLTTIQNFLLITKAIFISSWRTQKHKHMTQERNMKGLS